MFMSVNNKSLAGSEDLKQFKQLNLLIMVRILQGFEEFDSTLKLR